MDKLTAIKIKKSDGSYSDQILISALAENVKYDGTRSVKDILDLLDARINSITSLEVGSTTGDIELMDLRVGANGKSDYISAGQAVRSNINKLQELILIQETAPGAASSDGTTSWNKLWINNDVAEEIEIPTKDEFDILLNTLTPVNVLTWQSGDFNVDGTNHTNSKSIRSTNFIPDNIIGIMCSSNYKFCVWAWDKETGDHVGHLKEDGTFGQTSSYKYVTSFALDKTLGYKYKVTFYNENNTTNIATSAGVNCITYRDTTDTTLSLEGVAADAAIVGNVVAPIYSVASVYNVGDYVNYNGTIYRCKTAIGSSGETWTIGHWEATSISNEFKNVDQDVANLKSALNKIDTLFDKDIVNIATLSNNYLSLDGVVHSSSNWRSYTFNLDDVIAFSEISSGAGATPSNYYQIAFYSDNSPSVSSFISGIPFVNASTITTINFPPIPHEAKTAVVTHRIATEGDVVIKGVTSYDYPKFAKDTSDDLEKINSDLAYITTEKTVTMVDPIQGLTFTEGKYVTKNGTENTNSSYKYSNKITVAKGDVITNDTNYLRFVCAYNGNTVVSSAGSDTAITSYTVPEGIDGLVISVLATGTGTSNNFTRTYTENVIETFGEKSNEIAFSVCGNNSIKVESASVDADSQITITKFPKYMKKGISLGFFGKFSAFTSLKIGKGYQEYRGSWLEIDSTNIVSKYCTNGSGNITTVKTTPHQMSFSNFIGITITVKSDNDAKVMLAINTLEGSKTFEFDWSHEFNGSPFAIAGQSMTDVKLEASANDAKCPMWLFGDSYFGVASNRVIGQLINLGYAEGVLIDGRAGNNATHAYDDFMALWELGARPKYLVWCLGMNGNPYNNIEKANVLKGLSEKYGFEVILGLVPTVPDRATDNEATNTGYLATNLRTVNFKDAVGANSSGEWYTDYLSNDGVHPTVIGAQALAMRLCVDVPEIMQYGFAQGKIGDSISGDQ